MNNRIKQLRKNFLKMTQKAFADELGLSENFIWQIEKGDRIPSDRTISDICRKFNVNPQWLRNGDEPMFMPEMDTDTDYINELLSDMDNPFLDIIRATMRAYMDLTPENQQRAKDFAASLKDKLTSKDRD